MTRTGLIASPHSFAKTIKLGDFEVTTVLDGYGKRPDPEMTFGTNQTADSVAALLAEHKLPTDWFVHCFVPTLVKTAEGTLLFDTGFGPMGRADGMGQLRARLAEIGLQPTDIDIVVMTHLHPDHVAGLMEEDGPAFPKAKVMCNRTEFDFWMDEARMGTPAENAAKIAQKNCKPLEDKVAFYADGEDIVPGVTPMDAPGHTPGHSVFMLESAGEKLMLTADTANHHVLSLERPDWEVSFDFDKGQANETRKRIFGMLADENIPFVGHHMPFPAVGYVTRTADGFHFVPATYQFG